MWLVRHDEVGENSRKEKNAMSEKIGFDHHTATFLGYVGTAMPKIPSAVMDYWQSNPTELQQFLAGLNEIPVLNPGVWLTVMRGTLPKSATEIGNFLKLHGMCTDKMIDMDAFARTLSTEVMEVDIVKLTTAMLGFRKGSRRGQVYARALAFGFQKCTSEDGMVARLAYNNQKPGERLYVAMDRIRGDDSDHRTFVIAHNEPGLVLEAMITSFDDPSGPNDEWLFNKPREQNPPPISVASEHPVCTHF